MSVFTSRPALRWAVPAGVLAVAIAAGSAGKVLTADAAPSLPPRTAAQLLVDLQTAKVDGLSGTVVQRADLGLPSLPGSVGGDSGSSSFNSLVTGSHTLKVWYSGEDKQRLALLGTLGESDVIHNGRDVWTWSSDGNTATHRVLTERSGAKTPRPTPSGLPTPLPSTPEQAADAALAAIDPTTKVTTDGTASVAGRSAYELVLSPRDTASLVGQVRVAIDATEHVPLRVRVYAKGASTPAAEVGFTQVSFTKPADEQFQFTPPPGTKVTEAKPDDNTMPKDQTPGTMPKDPTAGTRPTVVGKGWTAILVANDVKLPSGSEGNGQFGAILNALPRVSGSWGSGRLLTSSLFSVLITDDGRALVGAVTPQKLYAAAAR